MPNTNFVIFGISSDLAKIKLLPAIYFLIKNKKISKFNIIGLASSEYTVDFLVDRFAKEIKNPDPKILDKMKKNMSYLRGDFRKPFVYEELKGLIKNSKCKNTLFYLSTLPSYFESIVIHLSQYKLNKEGKGWVRIVFEKPFGDDLRNAIDLNKTINKYFKEKQVFRIDHYLAKELVKNISILRFTNAFLEPLWNSEHIDHVQIMLDESIGIGSRAKFYDNYGAIKDVLQNHVLQLLALTAMEKPKKLDAKHIRNQKYNVLKSVERISSKNVVLGQYESYKKEDGVAENTKTETFVAVKAFIDNKRWKKVPFYLRAGKKLHDKKITIYVQFKDVDDSFGDTTGNGLVIQVQPNEGFFLLINVTEPSSNKIKKVKMDFCHECVFGPGSPEAYEVLFEHVLTGDQSVFVRNDEIEESWRIVESISDHDLPVETYKDCTLPKSAKALIEKDGREWFVDKFH